MKSLFVHLDVEDKYDWKEKTIKKNCFSFKQRGCCCEDESKGNL